MRPTSGWRLIVAAALAAGVAACGSGAQPSGTQQSVIKVGLIAPIGTPEGDFPSVRSALAAGIRSLNQRGGLNGHRVEMVFCNDQSDPNQTALCARQMVEEKVVAITGGVSLNDAISQPILEQAGIPIIGMNPESTQTFNGKNVYLPEVPTFVSYEALLGYAVKNNLLPVGLAVSDNIAGHAVAGIVEGALKQMTGGTGFVVSVPVEANTADFAPIAGSLIAAKPKSLLMIIGNPLEQGLMRALEAQGAGIAAYFTAPSFTLANADQDGSLGNQLLTAQSFPAYNSPLMKQFRRDMAAEAATGDKDASLDTMSPYAVYGWLALHALEQVTKGLKTITAQTVTTALEHAKDIRLAGVMAPWTPSTPGPPGFSRVSNTSVWFVGFNDGQQVTLSNASVSLKDIEAGNFQAQVPSAVQQAGK
jgi:ABC-type branched-subunit amino acid transport system substrate-binding protein